MIERNVSIFNLARAADDNIPIEEMARILAAASPVERLVRGGIQLVQDIGKIVMNGDATEAVRASARHLN